MAFDKNGFLSAIKTKTESTPVDGFGDVILRELNTQDTDKLRSKLGEDQNVNEFNIGLLLLSIVDENGVRVFGDDDFDKLSNASPRVINKLAGVALVLNGFVGAPDAKN